MTHQAPRPPGRLPPDKREQLTRARRLEWLTLALRVTVVLALYVGLGRTQALDAIWLKSLWSLLPPAAFLAACRIEARQPTPRFPYGFYRAGSIAFLTAALALATMGLYLCWTGLRGLLHSRHPGLATFAETGWLTWPGWPAVAALLYSIAVPLVAGRSRQALAIRLHDKGLYADAEMGRMSWMAGGAAVIGVLCVGLGLGRVDFVATLLIGADILRHGSRLLQTAVCDLIDEVPRRIGSAQVDPLGGRVLAYLESLDWIDTARVRLREEGRLLTGVAFVAPNTEHDLVDRLERARGDIRAMDWRLLDIALVPVAGSRCRALPDSPGRPSWI